MYLKSNAKSTTKPLSLFFSYAHQDRKLRDQLENHLGFLKRANEVKTWCDRIIRPGDEWRNQIDKKLNEADIILLLISPAFAKSDYCYDIEMKRAMERHERGDATVIPVILRPTSNWQKSPFGKLQALPNDNKAVTSKWWKNRDEAFKVIADGINSILNNNKQKSFFTVDLAKWSLIVDGDISNFYDDRIHEISMKLFQLTYDPLLSFIEKSSGSVQLKYQSSRLALSRFRILIKKGL